MVGEPMALRAKGGAGLDVEETIRGQAPRIAEEILAAARAHPGDEANFRRPVEQIVERFAATVGLQAAADHECTLLNGRADSVYARFVVEYEPPGSLRKSNTHGANQHGIGQVKAYIDELHRRDRQERERIAAVVLDGHWFIFVRFKGGRWEVDEPVPVGAESTGRFLRYLNALSTELAVTPENLIRDFGENTHVSRPCVSRLYAALAEGRRPRVEALFRQWSLQFSEICGYEAGSSRLDVRKLGDGFGVTSRNPDPLRLLFAIHTYYATFIKLLAVQIASFYALPRLGTGLRQVANLDSARLREYLQKMERGGVFRDFGINNFLEGDFFGWYLDVWDEEMDRAVRGIVAQLAGYSLVTLDVDPDSTRDLLKRLYQNLMPKALRHDLGEYYTPDWLAERLLNQLGYTDGVRDLPQKRVLDPACGSGTFLVLAIKRLRQWAARQDVPVDEAALLQCVLGNVVGFDLNPLAVISARTNYLLALGDLLQHRRGDVDIPVYLADSILTPALAADGKGQMVLTETPVLGFRTAVGLFRVPVQLVEARHIDQLANLLEECVTSGCSEEDFRRRLVGTFPLNGTRDAGAVDAACALFSRLVELEDQGVNGIWARIIKNAFAPLFCGRFDYVAGNPPWVRWDSLPDQYRSDTKPLWERYGLFTLSGWEARMGGGKKDLCALMTYAAADRYLTPSGSLGFVVTQTLFKTSGASEGFRRFRIGDDPPLQVLHVDDMTTVKPFEGAANRTAVLILRRDAATRYPVPYTYWRRRTSGRRVPEDASLAEVLRIVRTSRWHAVPVNAHKPESPWLTARPRAVVALRKVIGASAYQAKAGCCTWANGVYWVRAIGDRPGGLTVVANAADEGRLEVPSVQAAVETALLHPLLRGRDIGQWAAAPSLYIVMTQDPQTRTGIPESRMAVHYPRTFLYLRQFERLLKARSGYTKYLGAGHAFYSIYDVGPYTFAPYKLVWADMGDSLKAAVVGPHRDRVLGTRPVVPEHHVMMVPFESAAEAHYLCALVSSAPSKLVVASYTVSTQMSTHVLGNVAIPRYDPADAVHVSLQGLSRRAHRAAARGDAEGVEAAEAEIDELAARLWGLPDAQLKDIRDSLADLSG